MDHELAGRTDQMMSGYFDLPEETQSVLVDGWYLTGDLAEKDSEGFLSIIGRRTELIRSGGETIAPVRVEAAVLGFPGISEVAVVGVPDTTWGETVCAAVVLDRGASLPSVKDLKGYLAGRLAPCEILRCVYRMDKLPRTPATGQIQRSKVRLALITASSSLALASVNCVDDKSDCPVEAD